MEDILPFPSWEYFIFFGVMLFARGADFFSTWVATPNLILEGNPIAKRMGWRVGMFLNFLLCVIFGLMPMAAIIISTSSVLVAARNFQNAWLMRSLGEEGYRDWFVERLLNAHLGLYVFCLLAQAFLYSAVGVALMLYSRYMIPFAIGLGIISYALTVLLYTSLSVWRIRRRI